MSVVKWGVRRRASRWALYPWSKDTRGPVRARGHARMPPQAAARSSQAARCPPRDMALPWEMLLPFCRCYCSLRGAGRLTKYCALAAACARGSLASSKASVFFGRVVVVWLRQGWEWLRSRAPAQSACYRARAAQLRVRREVMAPVGDGCDPADGVGTASHALVRDGASPALLGCCVRPIPQWSACVRGSRTTLKWNSVIFMACTNTRWP